MKRFTHDSGDILGVLYQVMVLRDCTRDFHHRRFLKRVGADHVPRNLAGHGDQGNGIHLGVGQAGHQVQGTRAGGRHHDARPAGRSGVAFGREDPPLFVARQDRAHPVAITRQRLVHRHARPAGIGEDDVDTVAHERLDQNVRSRKRPRCGLGHGQAIVDGGHGILAPDLEKSVTGVARSATAHGKILQRTSTLKQSRERAALPKICNALVTGASSGIGRELVCQLVRDRGMTVLATARRRDRLESLSAELPPGRVQIFAGDLADQAFRQALWEKAEAMPGGLDLLVNNAGLGNYSELEAQDARSHSPDIRDQRDRPDRPDPEGVASMKRAEAARFSRSPQSWDSSACAIRPCMSPASMR